MNKMSINHTPMACAIPVQVYCESRHGLPVYAHMFDSGMDVCANLPVEGSSIIVPADGTVIVPTGLFVAVPPGYEFQVRPRSGMSYKTGLRIANSIGTIDAPYRGEIGVIIWNTGPDFRIDDGKEIAQLVLAPVYVCKWVSVTSKDQLPETSRGTGGYGSTDKTV